MRSPIPITPFEVPTLPKRLLGVVLVLIAGCQSAPMSEALQPNDHDPPRQGESPMYESDWQEIDQLVSDQKMAAALDRVEELLVAARSAGETESWGRALVRAAQLRGALGGYDQAVRQLLDQDWPPSDLQQVALELFVAHSLVNYLQAYSWEISQREKVAGGGEVDLSSWTREQIVAEANRRYSRVWDQRQAWGEGPMGRMAEYVATNDYPARIRGTLRDALTYLWVELLADTSLWSPAHSNEIFRLDRQPLVAQANPVGAGGEFAQADTHPLLRIAALLGDLEAWHQAAQRPEAALEARLERLRRLRPHLDSERDRELLENNLRAALDRTGRNLAWWSMGQAELAEAIRTGDSTDTLVRALAEATAGRLAHPESPGGRRCAHLEATLTAPSYHLEAMATDSPGQRSIRIAHANLDRLYFRAFALDLQRELANARGSLRPRGERVRQQVDAGKPLYEWTVDLPPTPDLRSHYTYVTPPMDQPGAYLVAASARADFRAEDNRMTAIHMFVGDLVLETATSRQQTGIAVRSGTSGDPLAGVDVGLYVMDWRQPPRLLAKQTSRDDGSVVLPEMPIPQNGRLFLLARQGKDIAVLENYPRHYHQTGEDEAHSDVLIYTDRSAYRPGQRVRWKVVAYGGENRKGRFQVLPERQLTVRLQDANGEEVATSEVETNSFGSAAGEFSLPSGRLLGTWSLATDLGGWSRIQVEEYKRPTFEVVIEDPPEALRLNREAVVTGSADYYFGLPVSSGAVDWRVVREPVYPRWWWWGRPRSQQETQTIAVGTTVLDASGGFEVRFLPAADGTTVDRAVSYRYRLSAEVTDDGGETRSAERVFRLGFVAIEAQLEGKSVFFADQQATLKVTRRDLGGLPRPGGGAWQLLRLQQPKEALLPADQPLPTTPDGEVERFQTAGDLLRPRWQPSYQPQDVLRSWPDGVELASGELDHGENGQAELALGALEPGAYRLRYSTFDQWGERFETAREILVAGKEATPLELPLMLAVDDATVEVGKVLRIFAFSGIEGLRVELEIASDNRLIERRWLEAGVDTEVVELPIDESLRGGFGVTLRALRDHQSMVMSEQIHVPWDNRHLELAFTTFRDRLRPGTQETWRLEVKRKDGQPVGAGEAEVLAYMYDRSLDLFADHSPPDPRQLYPFLGGGLGWQNSLGQAPRVWNRDNGWIDLPGYPRFQADRLKFFDDFPIGGPGLRRNRVMKMSSAAPMAEGDAQFAEVAESTVVDAQAAPREMQQDLAPNPPPPSPPADPQSPVDERPRSDFSETAFWLPHLLTDGEGGVAIEVTVPDSVTEWNVWAHALTRELSSGQLKVQTRSVKELLVRPYLPRFLRAGDQTAIKVVVNNAGEEPLAGELRLELFDPETEASLLADFGFDAAAAQREFEVEPGGGVDLGFELQVPAKVGPLAVRVMGRAGEYGDGELRPLAVLPSRLHLTQSRFAALSGAETETLEFAALARTDDPSRIDEQLVVTLEGQLFYGVLAALPYLVEYPYQCTEQTLNRFVSTGILTTLLDEYPAIQRLAEQLAQRETEFESWDEADPNRNMLLEETPWQAQAAGGQADGERLVKVLDPAIARAQRDRSLSEIELAQTASGGFPWWPGGPPSPYMTLYLLDGFARALEHGVEVPRGIVNRAWRYLEQNYRETRDQRLGEEVPWPFGAYLAYVLSSYPDASWTEGVFSDDDRRALLDHGFKQWRAASPRLKAYLALALHREGRAEDAQLVFGSLMDSAKTDPDLGTYWAPEERSWLWYNDTVESHAFVLRALMELEPEDPRRHGLAQWLMLNKKLNHWKSTRATAEAIYALAYYLAAEQSLAVREEAMVSLGDRRQRFVFEPDTYTGKSRQLVVPGPEVEPSMAQIKVAKETPGLMFASATWHFSTEQLPEAAEGDFFSVERRYFRRRHDGREWTLEPLSPGSKIAIGDQLQVELVLRSKHAAEYVHLRDPRAAGFEPESLRSGYRWQAGIGYYEEPRDSATNFFFEQLPAGEVVLRYRLRAAHAGTFRVAPAEVQSMYAPEFAAYTAGARLEVGEASR